MANYLTPAEKYFNQIGSKFISRFDDYREIKQTLRADKIGNKYYILSEDYEEGGEMSYTVRPATFTGLGNNYNTREPEYYFKYDDVVFTNRPDYELDYKFADCIGIGDLKYSVYSLPE